MICESCKQLSWDAQSKTAQMRTNLLNTQWVPEQHCWDVFRRVIRECHSKVECRRSQQLERFAYNTTHIKRHGFKCHKARVNLGEVLQYDAGLSYSVARGPCVQSRTSTLLTRDWSRIAHSRISRQYWRWVASVSACVSECATDSSVASYVCNSSSDSPRMPCTAKAQARTYAAQAQQELQVPPRTRCCKENWQRGVVVNCVQKSCSVQTGHALLSS